jgi:hypothetical protein
VKILAHKNLNLHSASSKGRLIHIASKQVKIVPDDVADHPAFDLLRDDGSIIIIKEEKSDDIPEGIKELLEKYPDAANHVEEARISGSPLHLVEAKLAAQEAEKINVSKDEDSNESKSDESKKLDEESNSDDEETDEESDDEETDDEKSE